MSCNYLYHCTEHYELYTGTS